MKRHYEPALRATSGARFPLCLQQTRPSAFEHVESGLRAKMLAETMRAFASARCARSAIFSPAHQRTSQVGARQAQARFTLSFLRARPSHACGIAHHLFCTDINGLHQGRRAHMQAFRSVASFALVHGCSIGHTPAVANAPCAEGAGRIEALRLSRTRSCRVYPSRLGILRLRQTRERRFSWNSSTPKRGWQSSAS